ncbi:cutinase [Crassisporium funariophilum]|nr:cutinase [Crassisporium funariophilum]KAF8163736.1 cutinase [Crassisporium funariophilum]
MFSYASIVTVVLAALSAIAAPVSSNVVDIEARQSCSDVFVYFARGTTETPTLGSVIGPGFRTALQSALRGKSMTYEGIDYPANIAGYLAGGDQGGGRTMADKVTSTANRCPNAKIVISGYSQGAQVTHIAANRLTTAIQNRVSAVVTFGDPFQNRSLPGVLQSRRKTFCNFGDLICSGSPLILAPHLTYGSDATAAATFVAGRV